MEGIILTFNRKQPVVRGGYEFLEEVDLKDIVNRLMGVEENISISRSFPDGCERVEIRMKSMWSLEDKVKRALSSEYTRYMEMKERSLCWRHECYQEVAAYNYSNLQGIILFDRHGEDPHEIHEDCRLHCSPVSLHIANTLQVENLTPERPKYWTKVLTWKLRSKYYGQMIYEYSDGDYETGYYDCCSGSPFYGPFATRQEASEATYEHIF